MTTPSKISGLPALSRTPNETDVLVVVDKSGSPVTTQATYAEIVPKASDAEAVVGTSTTKLLTPKSGWAIINQIFTSFGRQLAQLADVAALKTLLTLGSAAYKNTGTEAGQLPLKEDFGTAAWVNTGTGANDVPTNSQISVGNPTGYILGLAPSYVGTTSFSVGVGEARDGDDSLDMVLSSALTKTLSSWAQGGSNGSLDTGSIGASSYYYIWLIEKTDKSAVDILLSLSSTSPTMPTGWTFKRLIGRFYVNASSQVENLTFLSVNPMIKGKEVILSTRTFYYPPWDCMLDIEITGGGGAGGGAASPGTGCSGGGGGAGGYSRHFIPSPKTGSVTVTIGPGGTSGGAGTTSSFGAVLTASGGARGYGAGEGGGGGSGGSASGGNFFNIPGTSGGPGTGSTSGTPGGPGGSAFMGVGGLGGGAGGGAGTVFGGGGAGGTISDTASYRNGGNGGSGGCTVSFM